MLNDIKPLKVDALLPCSNKFVLLKHKHGIEDFPRIVKLEYEHNNILLQRVNKDIYTEVYGKDYRKGNRFSTSQAYISTTHYVVISEWIFVSIHNSQMLNDARSIGLKASVVTPILLLLNTFSIRKERTYNTKIRFYKPVGLKQG